MGLNSPNLTEPDQQQSLVIGEGGYGCVHKPSLKCDKNESINQSLSSLSSYNGKVSKLLLTKDAIKELDNLKIVDEIDQQKQFHLNMPVKCEPDLSQETMAGIKRCRNSKVIQKNLAKYSLLVMDDGGMTLRKYRQSGAGKILNKPFLEAVLNLLQGVESFLTKGYIHRDIKSDNLVYNQNTFQAKFIDFGLMTTSKQLEQGCRTNKYNMFSDFYFACPMEAYFALQGNFDKFKLPDPYSTLDSRQRKGFSSAFSTYCKEISPPGTKCDSAIISIMHNFNLKMANSALTYDEFLSKLIKTFDSYGLGMALKCVFNGLDMRLNSEKDDIKIIDAFLALFTKMSTPDLIDRIFIEDAIKEYKSILQNYSQQKGDTGGAGRGGGRLCRKGGGKTRRCKIKRIKSIKKTKKHNVSRRLS